MKYIQAVPHLLINQKVLKMCDQYAIDTIYFPHGDIDPETHWDNPHTVESYTAYSLDIFLILFAPVSLYTLVGTLKSE